MRVIPECSSLVDSVKLVVVCVAGKDRALVYEGGAILIVGTILEEAVPVLE
jgi:hypothetical protein